MRQPSLSLKKFTNHDDGLQPEFFGRNKINGGTKKCGKKIHVSGLFRPHYFIFVSITHFFCRNGWGPDYNLTPCANCGVATGAVSWEGFHSLSDEEL